MGKVGHQNKVYVSASSATGLAYALERSPTKKENGVTKLWESGPALIPQNCLG